ncbi:MAG: hypothetical protein IT324_19055 [Anaerolineae bacterium]|nr:hypothetical protein [Anaerolineae bacterium]
MHHWAFRVSMLAIFGLTSMFFLREIGVFNERFGRVEACILLVCFFLVAFAMTKWQRTNEKKIEEHMDKMEKRILRLFE